MKMKKDKIDKYEEENRKYWMQRALQQEQDAHLVSERYLSKVGNQLASYRQDLISEIETFYARYAKDHKMSHAEAKRYLRDNEMKEFQGVTLEKFRAMALNPDTPTPLLDALAYRHRISRKEALLAEIERKTAELYGGKNGIANNVTNNLSEVYVKGKIQQMKNLADFGIVEKPILNLKAVQNKLATNWSGQEFSERIWGQSQRTFNSIQKVIDQGLTGGWSVDRISKELTLRTGVAFSQARTLVQTETTFYNNLATLDTIKELGAEYYEIVAVLDNNTSKICRRKNGKIYPVSKYKAGQTAPPFHVWCRSTIMPSHQSKDGEKSDNTYIDILMNDHKVNVAPSDKSLNDVFDEWEREGNRLLGKVNSNSVSEAVHELKPNEADEFFRLQGSYKRWYNELTDDERSVIYSYTTENYHNFNNIKRYGLEEALKIREKFWFANDGDEEGLPFALDIVKDTEANIPILEKAISKFAPEKSFKVYRGSGSISELGKDLGYLDFEVGQSVRLDKAFTSFSVDINHAKEFAKDGKGADILFEVTVRKGQKTGAYIAELADLNSEKEYLMKPNLKYNIISKKEDKNGMIIYGLEVVEDGV